MASTTVPGTVEGYGAAFLTVEQQCRFASIKAKICGNKAVDLANLEKNGMGSLVEAVQRLKWTKIATLSEVSYPDLVKAFYVCLKTEEDGTLTSLVKGTQIRISRDLLASLFDVSTSGLSGVHSKDTNINGLGIIGPEFKMKDGKLDINQLNGFNRLLHFIICQIIVPRSASFSTCARADSDLMYWAIQNQEINTVELIIERMKFASSQLWDTKSKLNISLPYAHLLTRIFQHFGINTVGDVSEKMGQAIRSRNLKKSGFSLVNGIWSKDGTIEGETIIGEAQEDQEPPPAAAPVSAVEIEEAPTFTASEAAVDLAVPAAVPSAAEEEASRRIEDIPLQSIEPFGASSEDPPPSSQVGSLLREGEQGRFLEEAPIQGEQSIENEAASQGTHTEDAPVNEGHIEAQIEVEEQMERSSKNKKNSHRRQKKILKKVHLKPILKKLDDQGAVLDSVQSAVSSVIVRQESMSNDISHINNAMKWFNKELSSTKMMVSEFLKAVGPKDPTPQEREPSGPSEDNAGPSGPIIDDAPAGPSWPSIAVQPSENLPIEDSDICQGSAPEKETLNPVEPLLPLHHLLPLHLQLQPPLNDLVQDLFPLPNHFPLNLPHLLFLPPLFLLHHPLLSFHQHPLQLGHLLLVLPPKAPSNLSTITPASIFNPPTPPSFITIIPEGAQLTQVEIQDIKDEFEVAILHSVLAVGTHTHKTCSFSPVSKKRRLTSTHPISSDLCYPPLWFSLSISNKQKLINEEYLQKVVFAHIFVLPFQNLSDHLATIFPYTHLSKAQQSKNFSMTEAKTEEQWARSNKDLYSQFRRVQAARYPPREAPLPLSEWFQIHHKHLFGPFIQNEIKFIRQYQMYSNYCYVNRLPESQLGQFQEAIRALSSCTAPSHSLRVDFATLVIPDVVFLPPLHALIMDSSVGTLIFERAARVMARLFVQDGRDLSFPRFIFKQYLQGHIKGDVLAPILSECDRLSPDDWTKVYPLSAQQLVDLNASQASSNQPPLTPGEFLDANSLHLIRDSHMTWVERYKGLEFLFILLMLLFPSVVKEDLVGSQGVVFPSVVKEDLVRDPGCCSSLLVKEDQLSWVLYCP
ncbi:hypothetical protein Taro_048760 [Colocasia esculenta]|uniref:Putative plant transposon protein domain-containing protein n=1 Tax=Colocasia esculenta TaxID=4460 RepID=A0A843X949_COLES|nr:hypothetical protein [Colocasia esculenta]